MELRIINRHGEVSDTLRTYVEKKMKKFDRLLTDAQGVDIELSTQATRTQGELNTAQATLRAGREVLRAEVKSPDQFEAIDQMIAKLQRQVERYKGKRQDRRHGRGQIAAPAPAVATVEAEAVLEETEEEAPVVRRKRFQTFPMTEREAVEQMELLGHDFFLYQNPTSGRINLVYRRKDGGYGVLEPEIA